MKIVPVRYSRDRVWVVLAQGPSRERQAGLELRQPCLQCQHVPYVSLFGGVAMP